MTNIIEKINQVRSYISDGADIDYKFVAESISDPIIRSFVIQHLSSPINYNSMWFKILYDIGIFDFSNIPASILVHDAEGKESRGFGVWEAVFLIWEAAKQDAVQHNILPLLLELINSYIDYVNVRVNDPERNPTTDYYFCQFILLLPDGFVTEQHLNFIVNFGLKTDRSLLTNDLTGKFFEKTLKWAEKGMAYRLLDIFFSPSSSPSNYKINSVIDSFHLEQLIKRIPVKLYDALGTEVIYWLTSKIKNLAEIYTFQFLKFNIPSIEPDSQNTNNDGLSMAIVNLLVNILQVVESKFLNGVIRSYVEEKTLIFQRIAFYFIDQRYDELKVLFWKYENPLSVNEIKLEVYRLIIRHCEDFTDNEIAVVIKWIDALTVSAEVEERVDKRRYVAFEKLEWISALEPIRFRSEAVASRYRELMKISENQVPSHPGYDSYFSISSGDEFSKTERILKMEPLRMLNLLADKDAWNGYNHWGLEQDVREYVLTNASLVMANTKHFVYIPVKFLYYFVDGFRALTEQKSNLDYEQLLVFFLKLVETREELWDFEIDSREKSSAIGMIGWLVQSILEVEEVGNCPLILDLSAQLLLLLDKKYTLPFEWLNNDPGFDIINATRGKFYRAMITCSLNTNKVSGDEPGHWREDICERFTELLSSNYEEFFWSIGFYTPELSYLNFDWLKKHKTDIYTDREVFGGDVAFYGYLLYATRVYSNLFDLLFDRYVNSISRGIKNGTLKRRLAEHIYVAYVIERPNSNVLMEMLFTSNDSELLKCLVERMRNPDIDLSYEQLVTLWSKVLDIAAEVDDRTFRQAVAETVELVDQARIINKRIFDLFERAILFIDFGVPTYRLMRTIESKVNQGLTEEAGRLLYLILNKSNARIYLDTEMVNQILIKLYKSGEKELADDIAIEAVYRKNFEAIRIYNQFQ